MALAGTVRTYRRQMRVEITEHSEFDFVVASILLGYSDDTTMEIDRCFGSTYRLHLQGSQIKQSRK
jgi:hypothetical protein